MPIVELNNVAFAYNGESVLEDVNFVVNQEDFIAMISKINEMKEELNRKEEPDGSG